MASGRVTLAGMSRRAPRRTGTPALDQMIDRLLDASGATANRDQLFEILATATRLAGADVDRLDLKITNAALKEMAAAFQVFAPYKDARKATMFGSARTLPNDPLYAQAQQMAAALAGRGWMVVTGAGPGIMAAGLEGAGREMSFGVNIRLPFEQSANAFIAQDPKLVEMKYFFTRKLMLMKESDGFVVLPGGFGTLDEAFELLTLLQTGKAEPAPLVLLDVPGGTYWHAWERFLVDEVAAKGLVSPDDWSLWRITDDVNEAVEEIIGFYRNYRSSRWVGDVLVLRVGHPPTEEELERLNAEFSAICRTGGIWITDPMPIEVAEVDQLDAPRLALRFDRVQYGRLRELINALNRLKGAEGRDDA
jgi:uncharacterized protein (TIGR00730 family)